MAQRINTIIEFEQKSIGKSGALFDVKKIGQNHWPEKNKKRDKIK